LALSRQCGPLRWPEQDHLGYITTTGSRPRGDRSFCEEHRGNLLAYATRLTAGRATAEDVVQETPIRAGKHASDLVEERCSIRGCLLTVARNIITDWLRVKGAASSPATAEQAHLENAVNTTAVLDALGALSVEHHAVLVELYYRGRTVGEAAEVLGIPPGTVKSRSYHALRAMRATIGGHRAQEGR
jgi:RNA polymerase sigma-70 factor (ECF subfamily)